MSSQFQVEYSGILAMNCWLKNWITSEIEIKSEF